MVKDGMLPKGIQASTSTAPGDPHAYDTDKSCHKSSTDPSFNTDAPLMVHSSSPGAFPNLYAVLRLVGEVCHFRAA